LIERRRNAYDFIAQITQICKDPTGKTALYHAVKTAYRAFERWLNKAIQLKLIQPMEDNTFQTTIKGHEFLKKWAELQTFLKEE